MDKNQSEAWNAEMTESADWSSTATTLFHEGEYERALVAATLAEAAATRALSVATEAGVPS